MSTFKYKNPETNTWEPVATPDGIGAVPISRTVNGKELKENISLTPEDTGAVNKTGDKMTGTLTIEDYTPTFQLKTTADENYPSGGVLDEVPNSLNIYSLNNISDDGTYRCLSILTNGAGDIVHALKLTDKIDGVYNYYNVLHTGNKNLISPADIGAATQEEVNELKTSVSEGKALIAAAVTDKGVETAANDSFATMAENINNISTTRGRFGNGVGQISSFELMFCAGGDPTNYVRPI